VADADVEDDAASRVVAVLQATVAATAVSAANPAIAILILITSRCGRLLHLRR
jgi:hypothetical protein